MNKIDNKINFKGSIQKKIKSTSFMIMANRFLKNSNQFKENLIKKFNHKIKN